MKTINAPFAKSIGEVVGVTSPNGTKKVLLIAPNGQLVNEIQGRSSFTTSGSWESIGEIIQKGIDSGRYPKP